MNDVVIAVSELDLPALDLHDPFGLFATRALDGADLESAATRTIREGDEHGYRYGLIALDSSGHHFTGQTAEITTLFAVIDETGTTTFTD